MSDEQINTESQADETQGNLLGGANPEQQAAAGDQPEQGEEQSQEWAAPEQYEFQYPEGVEVDPVMLDRATQLFKESRLPQDQAQKFVDEYVRIQNELGQAFAHHRAQQDQQWAAQAQADPEIGGPKFQENLGIALKAMEAYGSQDLIRDLEATGMGSNPHLIKAFYKAGLALREDGFQQGGALGGDRDPAKVLYPNMQ